MSRYSNIPKIQDTQENNGACFYYNTFFPKIPLSENDIYVLTGKGDRLDLLANQFYGDPNLWWVISSANGEIPKDSLNIPLGTQLRIPSNPGQAINLLSQLNS